MTRKILVVNPNSSVSMTDNLEKILVTPLGYKLDYFTAPLSAPPEISDPITSELSCQVCLPVLIPLIPKYDGFLICCYSDHPLIAKLKSEFLKNSDYSKIVLGIFQASLLFGVANSPKRFGILTSSNSWELILDNSTKKFFGDENQFPPLFVGTIASNVNVLGLSDEKNFRKIVKKSNYLINDKNAEIILLGCAGLSGLEHKLQSAVHNKARFIDSVKIGLEFITSLINFELNSS
ncbi:Dcg1p ASCRUDRAFT_75133 [Ascoidea rubescens DSM 1968]|uniref:DCG1-like protein n=1 Tax=Ascoidea rubescens DSM 1968 TaxID=1344418 RepID=A0A1D2VJS2_9ASCO|nr:hypothetical protein ASCRUDRAFT_75133 [Ascoidea rubescens DSM 1968]ODV61865.1 hypothetical protein ASCRUDRAFT_75133 [Ascoidea rubescens DSM 1968]